MKKLTTLFLLFVFQLGFSQKQSNIWYFGQNAGIDFNSGTATAFTGNMSVVEGSATISDSSGQLLFYSDGISVWNRTQVVMPNGNSLDGGNATQSALIVPHPGDTSLYLLFTISDLFVPLGFKYSVVDMTLDGGLGDISQANIPIFPSVAEKLTAVRHSNGTDYWVMTHEWGNDIYRAYMVTAAGLDTHAVISHAGIVHDSSTIQNGFGQMKFSSCGSRIANAVGYLDTVDVLDFNNATGLISNSISIPFIDHVAGVEFSPDNNYLYVSSYDVNGTLSQFDLNAGSPTAIIASKTILSTSPDIYDLQQAPDGNIYASKSFSQFLGVVNEPNLPGAACDFVDFGLDLDPTFSGITSSLGLPNFIASYFDDGVSCSPNGIRTLEKNDRFSVSPNPSSGEITIHASEYSGNESVLKIFTSLGQLQSEIVIKKESISINLPKGFYFFLFGEGSEFSVEKVVIN